MSGDTNQKLTVTSLLLEEGLDLSQLGEVVHGEDVTGIRVGGHLVELRPGDA